MGPCAVVIFSNSGGDTILLKKSGVVGFWRPSELRVLTLKIGLEEFLSGYTARALFPRDSHYVKSELFIESLD